MKHRLQIFLLFICCLAACRKQEPEETRSGGVSLDSVRQWFDKQPSSGLKIATVSGEKEFRLQNLHPDWNRAQSMPREKDNYWLIALDGQPIFQGIKQGYRKIAFTRDADGKINALILEIIPDGLTFQRRQKMSTADFTGHIFFYDQNYRLLGGEIRANGRMIGAIIPFQPGTRKKKVLTERSASTITADCEWVDANYVDAEDGVVIYSYKVCNYRSWDNNNASAGGGFNGGRGDYAGSAGGSSSAPAVSNLPGETGPKTYPKKLMDCFGNIPDKGAVMKVTIYVQSPWPGTSFNIGPNSVGHTAIGLTKTGGGITITQVVGFYPDASGFAKIHAPSKVVDNGGDLNFNSSITYNVSAAQFTQIVNYIASPPPTYDLNNFNCTNFVYSACGKGGIQLPDPYSIVGLSGAGTTAQAMTPAGLGSSIDAMKGKSNVNTTGGTTPNSKGPCK